MQNLRDSIHNVMPSRATALAIGSLALAAAAGVLASVGIAGVSGTAPPSKTVTVNIENGSPGPAGPTGATGAQGPPGPAGSGGGATDCPDGFSPTVLVINHPTGHVTILTCLLDEQP